MFKRYLLRLSILTLSLSVNAIASNDSLDLENFYYLSTGTSKGLKAIAVGAKEEGSLDEYALKKNNAALIAQINQLTADLQNRDMIIANLQAQNAQLQNNVNQLTLDVQARDAQIVTLQGQNIQLQNSVNQLTLDIQARNAQIVTLQGQNVQLQNNVNQLTLDVQARDAQIVTLQGDNALLQNNVNQLTLDVQARDAQIVTLQGDNALLQNNVNQLTLDVQARDAQIVTLQGQNTQLQNSVNQLTLDVQARDAQIVTLQNQVTQKNTTIQNGINKLDPSQGNLDGAIESVAGTSNNYTNLFNSLPAQYLTNTTDVFSERNLLIIMYNVLNTINQSSLPILNPNNLPATPANVTLLDLANFIRQMSQINNI